MSEPDKPAAGGRPAFRRVLRWLPASHGAVWVAATGIWLLIAMLNAAAGWPMIRTLAPAALLVIVGAAESHRVSRRPRPGT